MKVDMCWGCEKAKTWTATGYECPVYAKPDCLLWARTNQDCPFNRREEPVKKARFVNPLKEAKRGMR